MARKPRENQDRCAQNGEVVLDIFYYFFFPFRSIVYPSSICIVPQMADLTGLSCKELLILASGSTHSQKKIPMPVIFEVELRQVGVW